MKRTALSLVLLLSLGLWGIAARPQPTIKQPVPKQPAAAKEPARAQTAPARPTNLRIVDGARLEVTRQVVYDSSYVRMKYPNGDLDSSRGVCADVIVRALRRGADFDLQQAIAQDKRKRPSAYPGSHRVDTNIDHRRVVNHLAYWRKHATALTLKVDEKHLAEWKPGDLVYMDLGSQLWHCGVISDQTNAAGVPLLIHNAACGISDKGEGCASEDDGFLTNYKLLGHFRFDK